MILVLAMERSDGITSTTNLNGAENLRGADAVGMKFVRDSGRL